MSDNPKESKEFNPYGESSLMTRPGTGRPRLKHGGFAYLDKGRGTERRQVHIRRYLDAARQGLIDDLSAGQGEAALTAAEVVLIDRALALLGVLRLIEEYASSVGIIQENGELVPPLNGSYISYHNSLRQTLALLGLERKAGKDQTLEAYLEAKARAIEAKATPPTTDESQAPTVEDTASREIVDPRATGKGK